VNTNANNNTNINVGIDLSFSHSHSQSGQVLNQSHSNSSQLTPVTRNTTRNIHLHSLTNQNTDAIANNSTNGDVNMNGGSNSGSNTKMSNGTAQKYKHFSHYLPMSESKSLHISSSPRISSSKGKHTLKNLG
jgi:hypothetical protein